MTAAANISPPLFGTQRPQRHSTDRRRNETRPRPRDQPRSDEREVKVIRGREGQGFRVVVSLDGKKVHVDACKLNDRGHPTSINRALIIPVGLMTQFIRALEDGLPIAKRLEEQEAKRKQEIEERTKREAEAAARPPRWFGGQSR